jgi:transposase-like protein
MTVREIQAHLEEMYGAEVSPSLIPSLTDAVVYEVQARQARPLDPVYPIIYPDCIHVKVRAGAVRVKAVSAHRRHDGSREEGAGSAVAGADRGRQVMAAGGDGAAQPRRGSPGVTM